MKIKLFKISHSNNYGLGKIVGSRLRVNRQKKAYKSAGFKWFYKK